MATSDSEDEAEVEQTFTMQHAMVVKAKGIECVFPSRVVDGMTFVQLRGADRKVKRLFVTGGSKERVVGKVVKQITASRDALFLAKLEEIGAYLDPNKKKRRYTQKNVRAKVLQLDEVVEMTIGDKLATVLLTKPGTPLWLEASPSVFDAIGLIVRSAVDDGAHEDEDNNND